MFYSSGVVLVYFWVAFERSCGDGVLVRVSGLVVFPRWPCGGTVVLVLFWCFNGCVWAAALERRDFGGSVLAVAFLAMLYCCGGV